MGVKGPRRFLPYHHTRVMTTRKTWDDYPPPVRDDTTGCLRWRGTRHSAGYGLCGSEYAHRIAYRREYGEIPEDMEVDHVRKRGCVWRDCVEPTHLEAVTHAENIRRCQRVIDQMAKEFCPADHPYSGHNLIIRRGKRECRICTYARNARNRQKRRERRRQALRDVA